MLNGEELAYATRSHLKTSTPIFEEACDLFIKDLQSTTITLRVKDAQGEKAKKTDRDPIVCQWTGTCKDIIGREDCWLALQEYVPNAAPGIPLGVAGQIMIDAGFVPANVELDEAERANSKLHCFRDDVSYTEME